jgi:PLD-like domain
MDGLYTNRNSLKDFLQNAFEAYGRNCEIRIASAFFSADEVIKHFVERGCTVRLIVRLGTATKADSLSRCLLNGGVQIRCFIDSGFHPKMYQFGGSACLVGSANLTGAGKWSNAEVVVMLPPEDPRFDELSTLFEEYWDQASPLDNVSLARYRQLEQENPTATVTGLDGAVEKEFGRHRFLNIEHEKNKKTAMERYREKVQRENQEFREAFLEVQTVYERVPQRLAPQLPLRIEIDQLFNYIREKDAHGDSYLKVPILNMDERTAKIQNAIETFRDADHAELENIQKRKLPRILSRFGSRQTIEKSSEDEIFEGLTEIYAFHDKLRYLGGQSQAKRRFFEVNPLGRVQNTLCFLLHTDRPDAITRIADCIFNDEYRLAFFGPGCIEEIFGWVNKEEVPICNGRTLKSIRWLGFRVKNA